MSKIQTFSQNQVDIATADTSLPVVVIETDSSSLATNAIVNRVTGEARPVRMARGGELASKAVLAVNLGREPTPWEERWLPILENDKAHIMVRTKRGMVVNAMLDKREWAELDREIFEMVKLRRNAIAHLQSDGLTSTTNLGEQLSQWRNASERVRPSVNMDGRSRADRDRTDRIVSSVPIPIYRTDYEIGTRELESSRKLGTPLDTFEAGEAASAIAEEEERTLFNGNANIVVDGNAIFGYTTLPARDTNTAAGYGGGDFGTISNVEPTFLGMLTALSLVRYHGPFRVYVAQTQYHEMLSVYTDGSGQSALQRMMQLPQIRSIDPSDFLADGNLVMVQMTRNVVDWRIGLPITNREWTSGDGQALFYAVLSAASPRLKNDVDGNTGIAHATGA